MWEIIQSPKFLYWFINSKELDESTREDIYAVLRVLRQMGPQLGRPFVDSVKGSRHSNLKELRVQSKGRPFRIFFAFDRRRRAVLLIGGNKASYSKFYERMIPLADRIFDEFLKHVEETSDEKND